MKKLIFLFIFSFVVLCSTAKADNFSSENYPDADRLFAWAEKQYPTLFAPSNGISQVWEGWYYRFYPNTKNYAGVNTEGSVYVTGQSFDGLLYVDNLQALLDEVTEAQVNIARLNDTGIITCVGNAREFSCPKSKHPGQDGDYGRDVTDNDDSDGHAGFSFTKLDNNGIPLPVSASKWSCVKDNVTGLIWEVKTDDGGLRDRDWKYSWYNSTGINDGGEAGSAIEGNCFNNGNCDTEKYTQQVNIQGLCGANDWRMPTKIELENILSFDGNFASTDRDYFPNTNLSLGYWTASPTAYFVNQAWYVSLRDGYTLVTKKHIRLYVRLVRIEQ